MTSLHLKSLISAIAVAALLGACDAKQEASAPESAPAAPAPAEETQVEQAEAPEAVATAAETAPAAADGSIGVKECDDYITAYEACLDKMPEAARASMQQGLDAAVAGWKSVDASAKDELAAACKTAYDSSAPAMQGMGCDW